MSVYDELERLNCVVQHQEKQLRAVAGVLAAAITYVSYDDADDWDAEILEHGTPSALTAALMRGLALTEQGPAAYELLQAQEQLTRTALDYANEPYNSHAAAHRAYLMKWRASRFLELCERACTPPDVILPPVPERAPPMDAPEFQDEPDSPVERDTLDNLLAPLPF